MKVLNVNMSLDPILGGGTAERTFQLSRFLVRSGVNCSILTTNIGLTKTRLNDLKDVEVNIMKSISKRFYIHAISLRRIRRIVRDADIIHLINHWTIINAVVYLIARRLKKPYVICPAGALSIFGRSITMKRIYNKIVGERIIRNASACIAISQNEISNFISLGIEQERIHLIPNGVAVEDFPKTEGAYFKKRFGIMNNPFILFMGRLNNIKGPDLLLEAFCNIGKKLDSRYHLVFAGPDGGMLSELKMKVQMSDLSDRIHFIGYIERELKSSAYFEADLLVIPSRQEAMSIVVLEAGITHTPVLITDQCGFNLVSEIGGGKVVPATIDGLTQGLLDILGKPKEMEKMGENLHSLITAEFSWEKVSLKFIELYNTILHGNDFLKEQISKDIKGQ